MSTNDVTIRRLECIKRETILASVVATCPPERLLEMMARSMSASFNRLDGITNHRWISRSNVNQWIGTRRTGVIPQKITRGLATRLVAALTLHRQPDHR